MTSKEKKHNQLGMNPSTASHRLLKDLLFSFIKDRPCSKCGELMVRENFSVEHIMPWLDSSNPIELYFDLTNISYSHLSCNIGAARKPWQKFFTKEDKSFSVNERAKASSKRRWAKLTLEERQAHRREQYLKHGK